MASTRSPNYPNHNLNGALDLVRKVFSKDGRNKVSRETIVKHLGHEALSGPALGKLGALRAYGLIEGAGDELRVTEDAIAAMMAPLASKERKDALARLALKPSLFQEIGNKFPTRPSTENLTYWLIQQGFSTAAAAIAANTYLETMSLVDGLGGQDSPNKDEIVSDHAAIPSQSADDKKRQQMKIMDGERIVFTEEGKPSQYLKLIASGEVDDVLLEALEDFVKRQRKRLKASGAAQPDLT